MFILRDFTQLVNSFCEKEYFAASTIIAINAFILGVFLSIFGIIFNIIWKHINIEIFIITCCIITTIAMGLMFLDIKEMENNMKIMNIFIDEQSKKIIELENELNKKSEKKE